MREIKFRAWDTLNEKMFIPCLSEYNDMNDEIDNFTACGRYKLMQYTGMKDRNGVDIYEGDILATRVSNRENGAFFIYDIVSYEKNMFITKRMDDGIVSQAFSSTIIAGNIHDGKELLVCER